MGFEMTPHSRFAYPALLAQWALTGFGIFCLVGAVMIIALTPEALPL